MRNKKSTRQKFIDSVEATEFRRLEYRLYGLSSMAKHKVFMVTSANQGEGKSTISSLLAITHAYHRQLSTLLIDCDLRRPSIHKMFGLSAKNGLAEVFEGTADADGLLKQTHIPQLNIITAGSSDKSPSSLLKLVPLQQLIKTVSPLYDMIILDSPPVIPVSDPLIIVDAADGIYWIIKAGLTKKKMIKHAVEMLGEKSEKIQGSIINNSKNVMPYYYDYSYYGKKYKTSRKEQKMLQQQSV